MTRAELKQQAKEALRGNWGWAILIALFTEIIIGILPTGATTADRGNAALIGTISTGAVGLLGGIIAAGMMYTFLNLIDGHRENNYFSAVFSGFTQGRFVPTFLTTLLSGIFVWLWSLLLVIPGLIKSYSYAMAPYIVKDMVDSGQEVAPTEAITASRQLMDGHKFELFVLDLSFIGWGFLSILTFGIGFLWLVPYIQVTKAAFYRNLAGDQFQA